MHSHDDVTPGTGDVRHTLNKAAAAGTASLVFQTNWSGRAEFGTTGDDNWHVKVSPDGATWHDALVVDKDTGNVGVGLSDPQGPLHVAGDDNGLVLENTQDPGQFWTIAVGRPGVFEDHLIISKGDINTTANHQLRLPFGGAPSFLNGASVADGETFGSVPSGALAHYRPYDGTRGQLAFRGATGSGMAQFRVTGWYHDGAFNPVDVAAWEADASGARMGVNTHNPSTTLHVEGPVRVGQSTVASLPGASSAGAGALIFVSDESGGAVIAFSDGIDWRRVTDRVVVS